MLRFLELTIAGGRGKSAINLDQVISFDPAESGGTVVLLSNGDVVEVEEPYVKIGERVEGYTR